MDAGRLAMRLGANRADSVPVRTVAVRSLSLSSAPIIRGIVSSREKERVRPDITTGGKSESYLVAVALIVALSFTVYRNVLRERERESPAFIRNNLRVINYNPPSPCVCVCVLCICIHVCV